MEKLFEELENKDVELRNLYVINEKASRMHMINDNKAQKELLALRKSLLMERNLKLDAFQRVDDLQSQLYDLEDEITTQVVTQTRPQTSVANTKQSILFVPIFLIKNKYLFFKTRFCQSIFISI